MKRTANALRSLARLALVAALLIGAGSCEHKPFCWHHPHKCMLKVDFAWWDAPEGEKLVKSMALYVYPKDGSDNRRIDFPGSAGGIIELNTGDYDFLCLNSDTETLLYEGTEKHHTFNVFTREAHPLSGLEVRAASDGAYSGQGQGASGGFNIDDTYDTVRRSEGTEDERVSREAENAYGVALEGVNVHGDEGVLQVVTMYPRNLMVYVHVIIEDVNCLEKVEKVGGTLSGLSGKVRAADAKRIGEHNIVPFSLLPNREEHTLEGFFTTFGHCPEDILKGHKLAVYIITEEGDHLFYDYDVTGQVEESPDEKYITVRVKGLDICAMRDMGVVVDPWIGIPPIVVPMD